MQSTSHELSSQASPWRAVVGGVVAVILLVSLFGGLAAAATLGVLRAFSLLMP
ncbi:hypothetical protein [Nocardioides sp. GXQ0305]|uniref:hypothetical protein n=1 Tax=Nocardioides sp. GXQ0305 TaxID=3423912 RepID=UPI003D7CD5D5